MPDVRWDQAGRCGSELHGLAKTVSDPLAVLFSGYRTGLDHPRCPIFVVHRLFRGLWAGLLNSLALFPENG